MSLNLCGVGPVSIRVPSKASDRNAFQLPRPLFGHAVAEAWPRVLAALEAGSSDRSRAAALVLRAAGVPEPDPAMKPAPPPPDRLIYTSQLAQLARSTRDPGVLWWALTVCERQRDLAECKALSPAGLVALDPEEGRHWLELAVGDVSRRDEAMQRAAQSRRFSMEPSLAAAVEAATPPDVPAYLAMHLWVEAIGIEAAFVNRKAWGLLHKICGPSSHHNRDTCAALADTLLENGQDLSSLELAVRTGERTGWPAERVAAGKASMQRLIEGLTAMNLEPEQPYSCAAVDSTRSWIRDRVQFGERAALEQRAASSTAASAALRR